MANNTPNVLDLYDYIWPWINDTDAPITLYTYDPVPSKGRAVVFQPGERVVYPKQVQFLESLERFDAVLYGGALGSGKSTILRWALIWLLVKWAMPKELGGYGLRNVPVGLFCETYTALEDRQIGEFKKIPETIGKYYDRKREFHLAERLGGGIIRLRNLDDPSKYASVQFAAIAVDELTYDPKPTYDFLLTRLRFPPIEHCPFLAATNPGQIGNAWVVKEFVDPMTRPGPAYDADLDYYRKGNCFIQALPRDNPRLTKQYLSNLKKLPEKQYRALVEGDWTVFAGQYFNMLDSHIHRIPEFAIPQNWNRFRAIDHGGNHPTVCLWGAMDEDGNFYIYREYSKQGEFATYHKQRIAEKSIDPETKQKETYRLTVGDPSMWSQEYSAEANKLPSEVYNDIADGIGSFFMQRAINARVQGWHALADGFSYELEGGRYTIGEDGRANIKYIRKPKIFIFNTCQYTWQSLTGILHSEVNVEDVKKTKNMYGPGEGDDEADALRYLYLAASPSFGTGDGMPVRRKDSAFEFFKRKFNIQAKGRYARF